MKRRLPRNKMPIEIAGDCYVYDTLGRSYKVKDLANEKAKSPIPVYGFNNKTWQMEKVSLSNIQESTVKKNVYKITCPNSAVEITEDQTILVNRGGDLCHVTPKDLRNNDLIMIPKVMHREEKNFSLEDVFPGKKSGKIKTRVGSKTHQADISFSVRNLLGLSLVCGMIDAGGCFNTMTGDIMFSCKDQQIAFLFASAISDVFLTEPSMEGNVVRLQNKVVTSVIQSFLENVCSQNEEVLCYYLSGYFHVSPTIGFVDESEGTNNKPFISLPAGVESVSDRLLKALLAISVVPVRTKTSYMIIDGSHIEALVTSIPILTKKMLDKVEKFMSVILEDPPYVVDLLGYKFGKSLSCLKSKFNLPEAKYERLKFFEDENAIMSHVIANTLNTNIKNRFSDSESPITKLIDSSVIGVKVLKIENLGAKNVYNLSCEKNHSFFLNGFLCYNE